MIFRVGVALAERRSRSNAWHAGYPGAFAGLSDPDRSEKILQQMKEDDAIFKEVMDTRGVWWRKVEKRSTMKRVNTQQHFALAEESAFKHSADLQATSIAQFSAVTSTKLVEDGMRDERVEEVSKTSKQ